MTAAHWPGERACPSFPPGHDLPPSPYERLPFHQAGEPKPSLAGLGQETLGALLSISLAGFDAAQKEKEPVRSLIEAGPGRRARDAQPKSICRERTEPRGASCRVPCCDRDLREPDQNLSN